MLYFALKQALPSGSSVSFQPATNLAIQSYGCQMLFCLDVHAYGIFFLCNRTIDGLYPAVTITGVPHYLCFWSARMMLTGDMASYPHWSRTHVSYSWYHMAHWMGCYTVHNNDVAWSEFRNSTENSEPVYIDLQFTPGVRLLKFMVVHHKSGHVYNTRRRRAFSVLNSYFALRWYRKIRSSTRKTCSLSRMQASNL